LRTKKSDLTIKEGYLINTKSILLENLLLNENSNSDKNIPQFNFNKLDRV